MLSKYTAEIHSILGDNSGALVLLGQGITQLNATAQGTQQTLTAFGEVTHKALADADQQLSEVVTATTQALPAQISVLASQGSEQTDRLKQYVNTTKIDLLSALGDRLTQMQTTLVQVIRAQDNSASFDIDPKALQAIRLLVQVLALATEKDPGKPAGDTAGWKENLGLAKLRKAAHGLAPTLPDDLRDEYLSAFDLFESAEWHPEREDRFVRVHRLIHTLASQFQTDEPTVVA